MNNIIVQKLIHFYQNNKKILVTIFKYLVVVAITVGLIKLLCKPPVIPAPVDNNIEAVKELRDKNNKLVAVIDRNEAELRSTQLQKDSLSNALKIKPKYIKGVDREITIIDTVWRDGIDYTPHIDSTVILRQDPWVAIKAVGKPKGSYIKFSLTPDTATRVRIDKNPLFGRPSSQIYVVHSNPYFKVTHGDSWEEKQKKAVFNLSVGVGYDPFLNRATVGVYAGVPIKTFYGKR